jgi:acyl-CoA dehydrogenase
VPDLAAVLDQAVADVQDALNWMLAQDDLNNRFAGAANFLRAFALALGGHYLLKLALQDPLKRTDLVRYYAFHIMPEIGGLLASVKRGGQDFYPTDIL